MTTVKVGVREFRERIASFLESDTPVAVTRRGETLGVYVPNPSSSKLLMPCHHHRAAPVSKRVLCATSAEIG
jgi:hypothetical protein